MFDYNDIDEALIGYKSYLLQSSDATRKKRFNLVQKFTAAF